MDIDEGIVQLGAKLDEWWDSFSPTLDSDDRIAQGRSLLRASGRAKKFARLKADGLAAIAALLEQHDPVAGDKRAASLIRGFEFGTRLADTLHDEFSDPDGVNEAVRLVDAIVKALHTIGSGRTALVVLLDHPDPGVRALRGPHLFD